ncbi:hypothetical protein [Aliidiomarina soli]|uniref:Uncharacterized protein n=1 Tax=Aliidiomarina soli TaxID=1928574 RepID=A0A432WHL4_9GAMM|nr:hypothetical protein [Aliidiomarina soli]RUO33290.1 hypothetical protein CWE14_08695 [Aliidiomarina soli]
MNDEMKAAQVGALSIAWANQMDAVWRVHNYATTLEAGILVASWYLFEREHTSALLALLLGANMLLHVMFFISHRHSQIQNGFNRQLRELGVYDTSVPSCEVSLYAHEWAKAVLVLLPTFNCVGSWFITIGSWGDLSCGFKAFYLTASVITSLIPFYLAKKLVTLIIVRK